MSTVISTKITAQLQEELIEKLLDLAFLEDFGSINEDPEQPFDLTTSATVNPELKASAEILLKEPAVVAGLPFLARVMERLSQDVSIELLVADGTYMEAASPVVVAKLSGPAQAILKGERLALNIMQRLSGIATQTRRYTSLASPKGIAILDTRKTSPGLRVLERYGVRAGGGTNHRFGLFDAILIKDNHLKIAGGVKPALEAAARFLKAHPHLPMSQILSVEVSNLDELQEALDLGAKRVLLDNMSPEQVSQCIQKISTNSSIGASECFVEVSGGITLENLNGYLINGVNAISTGALTHSARNVDLSLEFTD
ncbi:carboxylating nicotinate-nucleotide diphosphorylase [bacterium]|nr:carboxylating nicotinate-nucleotide diphosphorylase [bacterium]MBP9811392.1 carboxylating nicotinate-nucleotide diphosphorylase [bacterium]